MSSTLNSSSVLHRYVRYDARKEIMNSLGDLSDIELFGNQLLVAPYIQSGLMWSEKLGFPVEERLSLESLFDLYESGKGFMNPTPAKESFFQGKVMLVVKVGDKPVREDIRVGNWVFGLQESTRMVSLSPPNAKKSRVLKEIGVEYAAGFPCKFIYDTDIYGRIPHPDMVA